MKLAKILGLSLATLATLTIATTPAAARRHHGHQVCKMERHHGHHVRVCHWQR